MADINEAKMPLSDLIVKKLGKEAGRTFQQIMSDPELGPFLRVLRADRSLDGMKSVMDLGSYLEAKLDGLRLPAAMRGTFLALSARLPLKVIAPLAAPDRPQDKELVEALTGLCDAKEALSVKMANADFDLAGMRAAITQIVILRGLMQAAVRFTASLVRNLSVVEDGAVAVLRQAYAMVRPVALADESLREYLEVVERYLFGAAQQGVETRARLSGAREEGFSAGEQQAMHTAERKVRDDLAGEVLQLSDELRRSFTRSAPPTTDPRAPR